MYSCVKSCVKYNNNESDFFYIGVGLFQGQNNSPALFALFLEDLELFLQETDACGLKLSHICIILLLFADDMVILGDSPTDLQHSLNRLKQYFTKWGLEVNTSKSKIVVCRSRGNSRNNEKRTYDNDYLEVVDNFNYLGMCFNYTGSFNLNVQNIKGKSLKTMHLLYNNVKIHHTKPDISMQLFDTFFGSIIHYACPIWDFTKSKDLEQIHLKYCKWILGVKSRTGNAAVYGELGRYPLYISRYVQIIKYWLKLLDTDNIILQTVYEDAKDRLHRGFKGWLYNVQQPTIIHVQLCIHIRKSARFRRQNVSPSV